MYLPYEIPAAQILITVKTYPLPSNKYNELVCTAGFLPDGKWIRLYPVTFRDLPYDKQYSKYSWITLDLIRNIKDFRPESYRAKNALDLMRVGPKIDTGKNKDWSERKKYVLNEVFDSMEDVIKLAKSEGRKSLAVLKPREIVDFVIEPTERNWEPAVEAQLQQYSIFDLDEQGQGQRRRVIRKLPYKYFYKFLTKGDKNPRQLMIEDWELGALYWNCYEKYGHDERKANDLVRKKYFGEFLNKDLYLFLGTTRQYHLVSPNPFIIIGLFVPPLSQANKPINAVPDAIKTDDIYQQRLFND